MEEKKQNTRKKLSIVVEKDTSLLSETARARLNRDKQIVEDYIPYAAAISSGKVFPSVVITMIADKYGVVHNTVVSVLKRADIYKDGTTPVTRKARLMFKNLLKKHAHEGDKDEVIAKTDKEDVEMLLRYIANHDLDDTASDASDDND